MRICDRCGSRSSVWNFILLDKDIDLCGACRTALVKLVEEFRNRSSGQAGVAVTRNVSPKGGENTPPSPLSQRPAPPPAPPTSAELLGVMRHDK